MDANHGPRRGPAHGAPEFGGLRLAERAVRAADDDYTYFKQKHLLAAHKRNESSHVLSWVGSALDAIIDARNS